MDPQTPVVISQSKESEADTNAIKIIVLAALAIAASAASAWFASRSVISFGAPETLAAFVCYALFACIVILFALFVKTAWVRALALSLAGLIPLAVWFDLIYPTPSYIFLSGVGIFAAFITFAAGDGARRLVNSVHIRFFEIARETAAKFLTGLLIFAGTFSYAYFIERGHLTEEVGKDMIHAVLAAADPVTRSLIPNASLANQTAGEFFAVLGERAFEEIDQQSDSGEYPGVRGDFSLLSPQMKAQLFAEATANVKASFETRFGPIADDESVVSVIFRLVKDFIGNAGTVARDALAASVIIAVLSAIKGLSFLAIWIVELIAFLMFKFLVATGFARVTSELRTREFVVLP